MLALCLPACSVSSCFNGYFMAVKNVSVIVVSQIFEVVIQVFVALIFYALNIFDTTISVCLALILGLIISNICSALYLFYKYRMDYIKLRSKSHKKHSFQKQICKISLPVAFTTYIKSGLSTLKHSLIPIALASYGLTYKDSLACYGIISSTVMSLILFPFTFIQSYSNLLIPELSTYDKKNSMKKIIHIAKKSITMTFIFATITAIIFVVFAHWIDIHLYKSLDVETYIKLLAPIIIYIYMDNIIDSLLKSLDLQTFVMLINIIDLIISITFIKLLIPKYGVNGYIFILYFSEIFNFSLSLLALKLKLSYDQLKCKKGRLQ